MPLGSLKQKGSPMLFIFVMLCGLAIAAILYIKEKSFSKAAELSLLDRTNGYSYIDDY